ncbi:MAG: M56 family metallopeptidase [Verrucomicrobiales bacterium]
MMLLGAVLPLLLDSALKGLLLLVLAGVVAIAAGKASAATRHLVWMAAVFSLLVLPILSASLPGWRVLPRWPAASASAVPSPGSIPSQELLSDATAAASASRAPLFASASGLPPAPPKTRVPSGNALMLVWAAGFAVLSARLVVAHWHLRRAARRCAVIQNGPMMKALDDARRQLGVSRRVRLLIDCRRTIPIVWGVFRPRLLLPAQAAEWDESRLSSVLLHEMAHVKRRDMAVKWLIQLACALYWFNPLVWLAAWRLRVERERACDDLVLSSGVGASDYAGHLLHVATRLSPATWAACGLAMARPSQLEGRLLAVLNERLNRRPMTRVLALAGLVIGLCVMIPVAVLRAADDEVPAKSGVDQAATGRQKEPGPAVFPKLVRPEGKVAVVKGRLTDAAGKPIPKRVLWIVGTRNGERVTYQDGPTRADGSFEFADVPVGVPWSIFIPKNNGPEGLISEVITLPDDTEREIEARFDGTKVQAQLKTGNEGEPQSTSQQTERAREVEQREADRLKNWRSDSQLRQIELYNKQIELAEQLFKEASEQHKSGRSAHDAVIDQHRELSSLKQELAKLENDLPNLEKELRAQMDLVQSLRQAQQKRVEAGEATTGSLLALQKKALRLEREFENLRGEKPASKDSAVSASADLLSRALENAKAPEQLEGARQTLDALRNRFTDSHPMVKEQLKRIAELEGKQAPEITAKIAKREIAISAPRPGIVREIRVQAGAKIKKGDVLVRLDDEEAKVKLDTSVAQLEVAKAALRIREIDAKGASAERQRVKELAENKVISQSEVAGKELASEAAMAAVEKSRAEVAVAEQFVRQAEVELQTRMIRAPRDGTVLRVNVLEGESAPSLPLVIIQE